MAVEDSKYDQQKDEQLINDAFRHLLDTYLASNHRKKVDVITKAFNFAKKAHSGVRRLSGEPYILHPIAVAQIVCGEIGLGSTSICAALLHDVEEDTDYTNEDIANLFGPKVANIVEGLTKISGGIFGDRASLQAETFKKLLLTMSDDIRVILIKIADRLHNMRTLSSMLPSKQYKVAGETLYIYAPLADRLGLNAIKNELEDLLEKAATEPAHRPAFFRTLLESTVWVPGTAAQGEAVVEDSALDLQHWEKEDGTSVIPFFTSLEALQQAVEDEQAFVVMPVRTLFEMTLGETLFLNAKLPTGKEFMPREISLLIGEEGNPLSSQEILEGGESLILSEVAEPPAQMIDSLTTLFKTIKPVKRAFICSIKENEEAQPNLLIGIEADGDIEEIIQATGSVATDTLPGDEPIDICQVKKGEKGISHFITEHIAPFYERRWGGFLRDFKQNRII